MRLARQALVLWAVAAAGALTPFLGWGEWARILPAYPLILYLSFQPVMAGRWPLALITGLLEDLVVLSAYHGYFLVHLMAWGLGRFTAYRLNTAHPATMIALCVIVSVTREAVEGLLAIAASSGGIAWELWLIALFRALLSGMLLAVMLMGIHYTRLGPWLRDLFQPAQKVFR